MKANGLNPVQKSGLKKPITTDGQRKQYCLNPVQKSGLKKRNSGLDTGSMSVLIPFKNPV